MNQSDIVSWNKSHVGRAMIVTSGASSHFMSANVLLEIFEQMISPAFHLQRSRKRDGNGIQSVEFFHNIHN